MKKLLLTFSITLLSTLLFSQNVGIGTNTPDPSAALEISDTARGILIPRMTMNQRIAIQNPAEGLMVYQMDDNKGYWYFDGSNWIKIEKNNLYTDATNTSAGSGSFILNNSNNWLQNSAFGANSLSSNYFGNSNSAFGYRSLNNNFNGFENTAIGSNVLETDSSGYYNTSVGANSSSNSIGSQNTVLGSFAARYLNGYNNICLGFGSGYRTKGSNNILIGANFTNNDDSIDNKLVISNLIYGGPFLEGDFYNKTLKINGEIDNPIVHNILNFQDANANSHINTYENDIGTPVMYARYFYGKYGDLVIQGLSKTYTGNIHFVTGSTVSGAEPPTQRMIIMDNGKVGIGNFLTGGAPRSKLEVRDGDVYLSNANNGIILTSPNGNCWRVTIGNDGSIIKTSISCPNY